MAKKTRIRICIVFVIICMMWFSDWTLADEGDNFTILSISLNTILSFLAWLWVLFAKVAGTFLTNKWVYGEVFWFDALLWKYWNLMKNIANFWLWFYFVYVIFKWLIKQWKEDITKNLKKIIIRILVAGVWIQSSWFFTAAIIDISTITLSAAGAFPSQVISDNPYIGTKVKTTLSEFIKLQDNQVVTGMKITFDESAKNGWRYVKTDYVEVANKQAFTGFIDSLMPNADDVSWPLYYIWFYILEPHFIATPTTSTKEETKNAIMNLVIQWWTTIVFTIEMFVLCILALMRILYLWMFIIMSPIAILLRCIQQSWWKWDDKSFISTLMKQINFKSFFINVFKPTIVVLWLWVSVMFVALMKAVIMETPEHKPIDMKWVTITSVKDTDSNSNKNGNLWDRTYTTTIDSQFVRFTLAHSAKTFMEMILCIVTVIIIYFVVKVAMKMGDWKDFVSEKIWKVQDAAGTALTTLPVVPVTWYNEKGEEEVHALSAGQVFGIWDNKTSLIDTAIDKYQRKVNDKYQQQDQIIKSWFGDNTWYLSAEERRRIENAPWANWMEKMKNKRSEILSIKNDEKNTNWKWMTLSRDTAKNDGFWINQFGNRLTVMKEEQVTGTWYDNVWNNMISEWNSSQITDVEKKLEGIFKGNTNRIRAYADFFGLWNIDTWEELKKADIAKK